MKAKELLEQNCKKTGENKTMKTRQIVFQEGCSEEKFLWDLVGDENVTK
jgi:hypothetical protein